MPEPVASPDDVRIEYDTELTDSEIESRIERANREVERYVDTESMSEPDRTDLEAALAAYWIATRSYDRAAESVTSGRSQITYENEVVQNILETIRSLDPSGELPADHGQQADFEVF